MLFLYLFKLPESVRWSWAVGKFKTANKVILEMSRFNKVEVPKEFILSEEVEMHQLTTEGVGMAPLLASKVSFKVKMKCSLESSLYCNPKMQLTFFLLLHCKCLQTNDRQTNV